MCHKQTGTASRQTIIFLTFATVITANYEKDVAVMSVAAICGCLAAEHQHCQGIASVICNPAETAAPFHGCQYAGTDPRLHCSRHQTPTLSPEDDAGLDVLVY